VIQYYRKCLHVFRSPKGQLNTISVCGLAIIILLNLMVLSADAQIIADHNAFQEFDQIPAEYIESAKSQFRITYGHTSHGSQIITGIDRIRGTEGSLYYYTTGLYSNCIGSGVFMCDRYPSGDLGNPDRVTWAARTREVLNRADNDRNVVMWSWCGQANTSDPILISRDYLANMAQLEQDYPNVTFIYMTGHLVGTGETGNLHLRNEQIRAFVKENPNRVLFDFADIESYDPDGSYYHDKSATDTCRYLDPVDSLYKNWAIDWCAANPADELCAGDNTCISCGCAHSVHLNCNMKARVFWWMMARLAGWNSQGGGEETPASPDNLRIENTDQ
jgi:hypothetical protein